MKRIKFLYVLAGLLTLTSCFDDPGTDIKWEGGSFVELDAAIPSNATRAYSFLRVNDGTTYDAGMKVLRVSSSANEDVTVDYTIGTNSTAIEGVHYTKSANSVTIPAGEWVATLPITILADNINAGESWSIYITLTDATIDLGTRVTGRYNISVSCPSNLAGGYTFVTTGGDRGGNGTNDNATLNGSGTITATATAGRYTLTDYSFGVFPQLWGDSPAVGSLQLRDACSTLSFSGADQYGDTYSFTTAITRSGDGTSITFGWINTYGDKGTTTLTRTTGTWPEFLSSGVNP